MMDGFSFMFTLVPIFIGVIFVVVITVFIVAGARGLKEWSSNNRQPVNSGHVMVLDKRTHVWGGGHHHHRAHTSYYVTFEFEDGERQEFMVSGKEYGQIAQGDTGTLTYQGTRYHNFQRVQL